MIGFFFADKHSRELNVVIMEAVHRGLLPSLRRNDYEIAGRHGTVNFGNETYHTRQITVEICFVGVNEFALQELAREIAHWLSGKGILYFDDEPNRAYEAMVYESVETEQLIRAKRASVIFECQPFAKTIHFKQSIHAAVSGESIIPIQSDGTQATPCRIFFRNTGNTVMKNVRITRRALQR